jgi:hypothetical protein
MQVGGDDTLLSKSSEIGAQTAAAAAAMSRQAIDDLIESGTTDKTVEAIMAKVPQQVHATLPDGSDRVLSLADFQTEVIKPLCEEFIFPDLCQSLKGAVVRDLGSTMVDTGISADVSGPGPGPNAGDYPIPSANTGVA